MRYVYATAHFVDTEDNNQRLYDRLYDHDDDMAKAGFMPAWRDIDVGSIYAVYRRDTEANPRIMPVKLDINP